MPQQLTQMQAYSTLVENGTLYVGGAALFAVSTCDLSARKVSVGIFPSQLQVHAGRLYWADALFDAIRSAPLEGGDSTVEAMVKAPKALVKDDTYLYWSSGSGFIQKRALDGTGEVMMVVEGRSYVGQMLVDATSLYWLDDSGMFPSKGGLWQMPKAGGEPVKIAPALKNGSIAQDDAYVYLVDGAATPGATMKFPKAGGPPEMLTTDPEPSVKGIAVDKEFLYMSDTGKGTVLKLSLVGGSFTKLADGQKSPWSVSVDDSFVYWVTDEGAYRLAK